MIKYTMGKCKFCGKFKALKDGVCKICNEKGESIISNIFDKEIFKAFDK